MMRADSKKLGCRCNKCRECCGREPGWFMPGEIKVAAIYLKLDENEFIEKFCEEHVSDNISAFSPKRKTGKKSCIFLNKEGLCDIHPVKPYECRKVYGCEAKSRHKRIREIIKKAWR